MGNPTKYYNGLDFTWENVNNLVNIGNNITYHYNDNGIRTSKTINGVTHTYHLDGTKILSEEYGNKLILYIYDEAGSIIGMAYRTNSYASGVFDYYLFTKNLQGDIINIYDTNGNCVASYTYNAWGEHTVTNYTSANIGNINPFRYRGYYYDTETGFYYLNARYYDAKLYRFINADHLNYLGANGDLNAFNLYAYCSNNPVNCIDPNGNSLLFLIVHGITRLCNKKKNSKVENQSSSATQNKIIETQKSVENYDYGFASADYNGCEAVAIHNAKVLMGKDSDLGGTINICQKVGGMWFWGLFGTYPHSIGFVLNYYDMDYSMVSLDELTTPGIYIISYWNNGNVFDGIHTVALEYDGKTYKAYNRLGGINYDNPEVYAYGYICGYYLGER